MMFGAPAIALFVDVANEHCDSVCLHTSQITKSTRIQCAKRTEAKFKRINELVLQQAFVRWKTHLLLGILSAFDGYFSSSQSSPRAFVGFQIKKTPSTPIVDAV